MSPQPEPTQAVGAGRTWIQRSAEVDRSVGEVPPIVHEVRNSPGRQLDGATRAFFEPRFGNDFGHVRVHTDAMADRSARAVDARAYTVGRDLVFARGQYRPGTTTGRSLIAHELAHAVQQATAPPTVSGVASPHDAAESEAERISSDVMAGKRAARASATRSPLAVARQPNQLRTPTARDRREVVEAAARWLNAMTAQIQTLRRRAAAALAATPGRAAGPRAFLQHLNQEIIGRLLGNAISVFEAQKSHNPLINFPVESPEQTQLGEAFARAMEQFGLAIDEAHVTAAAGLGPSAEAAEDLRYADNHLRWMEANPAAPLAAGLRRTFTRSEVAISARRHQRSSTQLANLTANLHEYNLAGDGARRLRGALQSEVYRLVQARESSLATPQRDTTLETSLQPVLDQLSAIDWAVGQAVDRVTRAEARTRAYASDAAGNPAIGDALDTHFSTRDAGYVTLLADRLARMGRELRGQGSLSVHTRDPQGHVCGIGGSQSIVMAHAEPNRFYFCGSVLVGNARTVSTVVHETVHAVIPGLGSRGPVSSSADTPVDRAYAGERIYSHLSTEEALHNADSYAVYVDEVLGVQVYRSTPPQDVVTRCTDADAVHEAIARATFRFRVAVGWASHARRMFGGGTLPTEVLTIVRRGFAGADTTRARQVLTSLESLSRAIHRSVAVSCRGSTDREARSGALAYGSRHAVTTGGMRRTVRRYAAGTLRVTPAWFTAADAVRQDALATILLMSLPSPVAAADVAGLVAITRYLQEEAYPSVAGRTLQQHQQADAAIVSP